jgi:quercetin dioxygenase-like cupin family protein
MGRSYELEEAGWDPVGRRGAEGVSSHVLLPLEEGGRTRLGVTRIGAGGVFGPHVDEYAHVFCVLAGRGRARVGEAEIELRPGSVLHTEVGEPHGLWAAAGEPLTLVTANVYPGPTTEPGG